MAIKQLTSSELQIMRALWKLGKGFLKDIIEQFPQPRPAYTTIATVLNRMIDKGYIGFNKYGRDKEYFALLKKESYLAGQVKNTISNFFDNSAAQFASFFTRYSDLSVSQLEELEELIKKEIANKKDRK